MNVLHIDSSILGNDSITRGLTATIVAGIQASNPDAQVQHRDLAHEEVRHLSGSIAAGFRQTSDSDFSAATLLEHQLSETLVNEFLASEVLVIGAPMYNFSVSTQLKAWLDRIAQAGRTFQYTKDGPVGLSGGKRIVVVSSRGGFYAEGPFREMDFQESYLKAFFGFLGINEIEFVRVEGASRGDQVRDKGVALARSTLPSIVARLSLAAV